MVEQNLGLPQLEAGAIVDGKYEVVQKIGAASYTARTRQSDKLFVIGFLPNIPDGQKFQEDCKKAASLSQPNTASVLDTDEDPRLGLFILREFVPGKSLAELIKQKNVLNQIEFLDLLKQICTGLSFAHKKSAVHGRLKPQNIILTDDYDVKIVDFGLASLHENRPNDNYLASLAYSSPESQTSVDVRSDIYSLGAIMYEALAGCPPIAANNIAEMIQAQLNEKPKPFLSLVPARKVDPQIEAVILRCLEKKPEQRYQSVEALRSDLKRIEEGDEIKPMAMAGRATSSMLFQMLMTVLLLIAAGVGTVVFMIKPTGNNNPAKVAKSADSGEDILAEERAADAAYKAGQFDQAAEAYNKLEPQFQKFGVESREHVRVLHKLAMSQVLNKETTLARDTYTLLTEILKRRPDLAPKRFFPQVEIFNIGMDQSRKGDTTAAQDTFNLAHRIDRLASSHVTPVTYLSLVWEAKMEGLNDKYDDSATDFGKGIAGIRQHFPNPSDLSFSLTECGRMMLSKVDSDKTDAQRNDTLKIARTMLKEALEIRQSQKDAKGVEEVTTLTRQLHDKESKYKQ